jgi:hypothetical protein
LISVVFGTFFATGGAGSEEGVSSVARQNTAATDSEANISEVIRTCRKVNFFIGISFLRL